MDPIALFRTWRVIPSKTGLFGVYRLYEWTQGEQTAVCRPAHANGHPSPMGVAFPREAIELRGKHPAPQLTCTCGFYGCYRPADLEARFLNTVTPLVTGAFVGYGDVVYCERAVRVQRARIVALADDSLEGDHKMTDRLLRRRQLEGFCQRYAVPLVPWPLLERYGAEFGDIVDPAKIERKGPG